MERTVFESRSVQIEKEFNGLCKEIDKLIESDSFYSIPKSSFRKFDDEFEKVMAQYGEGDRINSLFVEHNYYGRKAYDYIISDMGKAIDCLGRAIEAFLERQKVKPWDEEKIDRSFRVYFITAHKLNKYAKNYNEEGEKRIFRVIGLLSGFSPQTPNMAKLRVEFCHTLLKPFDAEVDSLKVNSTALERECDSKIGKIAKIAEELGKVSAESKSSYAHSLCFEQLYKLRKKQLQFFLRSVFFEKDAGKKEAVEKRIAEDIMPELNRCAKMSRGYYSAYMRGSQFPAEVMPKVHLAFALKEIDVLAAQYYASAYVEKDLFNAWRRLDEIRHFIIVKRFREGVPLSATLIGYFAEEWAVLNMFLKTNLLRAEAEKRKETLKTEWIIGAFGTVCDLLMGINKIFKYNITERQDYELKIMSAQFSGGFTEYLIHDLFKKFHGKARLDDQTPEEYRELFECIKGAKEDDIERNFIVEKGGPDLDIHIKPHCAVLLKNAKVSDKVRGKMSEEFNLCARHKIKKVWCGINFAKNLEEIDEIDEFICWARKQHADIEIEVFDIKDLVEALYKELKRHGEPELNFPELDIYKVLDY